MHFLESMLPTRAAIRDRGGKPSPCPLRDSRHGAAGVRNPALLAFVAMALLGSGCAQWRHPAKGGWIDLFNGKDLTGWTQRTGTAKYFVENGCLVGETVVPGRGTNSFLCTDKEYGDFTVRFQFKCLAGDSGFYIRTVFKEPDEAHGQAPQTRNCSRATRSRWTSRL